MKVSTSSEDGLLHLPEHLHSFALMHRAMRRDARRLVAAALTVDPAGQVAGWWGQVRATIEWHHGGEDDIVWPELRRRVPRFAEQSAALDADHHVLNDAMDEVSRALAARDRAVLVGAAGRFDTVLHEHLRREEAVVFPAFTTGMSVPDYVAMENRVTSLAGVGFLMSFVLPWMFDGFDRRSVGRADATIPPPVRLVGKTVMRRLYERRWRRW